MSDDDLQDQFDDFYEDFFCELAKYGQLVEMHVCDNIGDHLIGNVYARYEWEEEAQRAVDALNDQWYSGRPLFAELSPVTDFREACCRQNETNECNRGGHCNFMHLKYASPSLVRQLQHELAVELRMRKKQSKKGWKEQLAEEEGAAAGITDDAPSWKKAKSGGDWRSGPSSADVAATAAAGNGGGAEPGSREEFESEKDQDRHESNAATAAAATDASGEKMRGWQSSERRRSDSPPSRS